ncbi:MEDS domain-containing protein [Nitrospira sp. Nam74]
MNPLELSGPLPLGRTHIARTVARADHLVQFYENEEFLLDALSGYIGPGLLAGEVCIVIATEPHRNGLEARLQRSGIDLPSIVSSNQYIALDAERTLATFMVDGQPNPHRFATVIGTLLERAIAGGHPVRAFGEMVALLWGQGKRTAATRLEELWNDLGEKQRFSLFCAYPMSGFQHATDTPSFMDICTKHSEVIPDKQYVDQFSCSNPERIIGLLQQRTAALEAENAERKKVEERLACREKELVDFLENFVIAIHQVGPDGTILWANKAELQLLGYAADEYIGRRIQEFHVDRDVIEKILAKLLQGEAVYGAATRVICKDGSIKDVLIHSNGLFRDGKFVHTRCFTQDVTECRRAEQEMQRLNQELKNNVQALEHSQVELCEKLVDLERFHDVAVGRELKMIELEKEVRRLKQFEPRCRT